MKIVHDCAASAVFCAVVVLSISKVDGELLFSSCQYSVSPAPENIQSITSQIVLDEKRQDYDQLLVDKRALYDAIIGIRGDASWDVKVLLSEVALVSQVSSLSGIDRDSCLEDCAYPLLITGVLYKNNSSTGLLKLKRHIDSLERRFGNTCAILPRHLNTLAATQIAFQEYEDALNTCTRSSIIADAVVGPLSPEGIRANYMRAFIYKHQGREFDADKTQAAAMADHSELISTSTKNGIDHFYLSLGIEQTYDLLMVRRLYPDAVRASEFQQAIVEKVYGRTSHELAKATLASAIANSFAGRNEDSMRLVKAACDAARTSHASGGYFYPYVLHQCARIAMRSKGLPEADVLLVESERVFAEGGFELYELDVTIDRALLAQESGHSDLAYETIRRALSRIEKLSNNKSDIYVQALSCYADTLVAKNALLDAESVLTTALAAKESQADSDARSQESVAMLLLRRGDVYLKNGNVKAADADFERAIGVLTKSLGAGHFETQKAMLKVKQLKS